MSNSIITRDEEITADLLNETILRTAADVDADIIAPESRRSTSEITSWDESPDTLGLRIPVMPLEPDLSIAEQLITAGAEEAEIERREEAVKAQ